MPGDLETVLVAPVEDVTGELDPLEGVSLREVSERVDLDRIGAMEEAIWHDGQSDWLPSSLENERAAGLHAITIVDAESGHEVVCAGWVRFVAGTDFATFSGGGTLPDWRGRGIYRAIVTYRANLATERGFRYLQVDASSESRPILERMGFLAVTTTTPFIWTPSAVPSSRMALGSAVRNSATGTALARSCDPFRRIRHLPIRGLRWSHFTSVRS